MEERWLPAREGALRDWRKRPRHRKVKEVRKDEPSTSVGGRFGRVFCRVRAWSWTYRVLPVGAVDEPGVEDEDVD